MSNRDSLGFGDLIPQDVVEIFAQENNKKGRKKRSNSLGRALGWLKGKKRKGPGANGQSPGLGPALDLALDGTRHQAGHKGGQKSGRQTYSHGNSHAVPKRDDDKTPAPPLLQENVFIETSRSKYLEDLHTEALEGLKMMQQEEISTGVEYQDNESTISTMTVQTDGEGGGFMTDSTIADTTSVVSVQSSVSTRSSRSGLTRQGSTFRPLNSGKKSERKRRKLRKTIGGIPRHVQKELGLDRAGWTLTQNLDEEQLYNGESDNSTIIDEPQQAAKSQRGTRPIRQDIKFKHPLNQIKKLSDSHAGHRDDLALLHHLSASDLSDDQRPRSLAVPWMTTANSLQQEPPNPVMSMSPQAAYMSKIIPNAVLPPSIEVVEISRGRSRNSLRTVSKSSLLLSSPAPSRASSRASSTRTTSSKASTITSASRYNPTSVSDNSGWSNSESSDTLVSDSSTISSSSTPRQKRSEDGDSSAKMDIVSVHSSISKASKCNSNGKLKAGEVKKEGQFVRSLSVMKPKRAPPPPSRSYSLHNKMKRRSRDLAEATTISGESSRHRLSPSSKENEKKSGSSPIQTIDSPSYHADTSSLDESIGSSSISPLKSQLQALKAERATMLAVASSKDASRQTQEKKIGKIVSPSSGYSSQDAISPYSSSPKHKKGILAKLQRLFPASASTGSVSSREKFPSGDLKPDSGDTVGVSPSVRTLRDLFNIPPHPNVHAPPPPPPEVWAHSKRTFELLLGPPAPDNVYAIIKRNPKDRRQQRQSPSASTEGSVNSLVAERKHKASPTTVESANGSVHVLETNQVQESGILNAEIRKENNERLAQNVDFRGNTKRTEKVRVSDILNGMLVKAVEKREERLAAIREEGVQTPYKAVDVKTDTITAISLSHISPSPSTSPSAAHHPPQSLTKQTIGVTTVVSPVSSWPPPPSPPVIPLSVSRASETDFPLPPPPMFGEVGLVTPVQVPLKRSIGAGDSSCITTSVTSVVKTKTVTDNSSTSQGAAPPPLTIPPPPPYTAPPPPLKTVPPPITEKISLPSKEVFPSPPKEFSPPPPEEFSLPPPKEFSPSQTTEVSPVKHKMSSPIVQEVPHPVVKDIPPTLVLSPEIKEVSPLPPKQISVESSVETLVSKLTPPSIPPPPPLPSQPQLSKEDTDLRQESISSNSEIKPMSSNGVLTPPESIPPPPPPPIELLHQPQVVLLNNDSSVIQEALPPEVSVPPATETSPTPEKGQAPAPSPPVNIPLAPPLPVQGFSSSINQPSLTSTKNQSQKQISAPNIAQREEPTPIVTPSLLQMVKLRSINCNPETPQAQEKLQCEVTKREKPPNNEVTTSSSSGEAPQKPIRRSMIMTSPTSTSPPDIIVSQPALPKSQSLMVPPASSSTSLSPMKKSPVSTVSPSMNLQEAIRLRTTARSKENPASRLSLHSPTSPIDPHKSPSSTASFIFSNKKVVIETKSASNAKAAIHKNQEVSSVTEVVSEAQLLQKEVKVPPPVAKKPKTTGKENETSEGMEQTAELEGDQESNKDGADETNGTAGTVKEGKTLLT
ncbi:putative protein KIAA1522 [Channa argus]|uniref:Uncharacterized protein n=1 Tax=Channa argus TaxID=215402 RepID=A0A6G1QGJ7_CHAAH|nr:putative protein KIAA1522 [Channa argus]